MAESDILQGEMPAGSEDCRERMKDDFEHPEMLYRGIRNRNDTNTDGIFGRNRLWGKVTRGAEVSISFMLDCECGGGVSYHPVCHG